MSERSDQLNWSDGPARPGWMSRALGVTARPAATSTAFGLGVLAAVSFAASMTYDWYAGSIGTGRFASGSGEDKATFGLPISSLNLLGLVYVVGGIGLLTALGAALASPARAERLRLPVTGAAVGLVAVLVAVTARMHVEMAQALAGTVYDPGQLRGLTTSFQPGMFLGYTTIGLAVAAIWLAAPRSRRAGDDDTDEPAAAVAEEPEADPKPSFTVAAAYLGLRPRSDERIRGLTVTGSGPVDHSVGPAETWPR